MPIVNKKAIFDNTFWQVIVRFVMLAVTLVFIKLTTNYLGTAGVGKYNTITTYINFFIVIADLGLFAVTVREISQNPQKETKIIANVMYLRLVSALLATIAAIIIVFATKYDSDIKIGTLIACGFLFFNLIASVFDMVMQYRLKMQFSALAELMAKIITLFSLILIIRFHGNFLWITATVALWGIFIFLFKYLFASRYLKISIENDSKIVSWIFNMAWPLGIIFIVNNLYFKIDTLLVFGIKGAAAAGIYTVAYKVLEVVSFIGSYFSSALKPSISQNIHHNKPAVTEIIQKAITIMVMAAAPVTILSIAFNQEIIIFLSNKDFTDSAKVLVFLALTLPLIYLDVLLLEIFIASDARKTFLKISLFIFLFNLILNLIVIPLFSYYGAAATTLLSEFLLLQIYLHYAKKIVPIVIDWPKLLRLFLASILTFVSALLLKNTGIYFLIPVLISAIIYFLLLNLFKIFTIKELKQLMLGND